MIYSCFHCGAVSLEQTCRRCGAQNANVPLDPAFYPEFQYQPQGFVKDLFLKGKVQQALTTDRGEVLRKYRQYEQPYFINYVHMVGRHTADAVDPAKDDDLQLFNAVLLRLGFGELEKFPALLAKLVRSTAFRFQYEEFRERFLPHLRPTLEETLRSYISEMGPSFRETAPMMLYTFYAERAFWDRFEFVAPSPQQPEVGLLTVAEVNEFQALCEEIYWAWQVDKLQALLEQFDQSRYVTIYDVDAMGGFQFEDFLAKMFRALGYDVQETKRTGDQGADLFVTRFGEKTVIQAKNYADNVPNSAVQQVLAAKSFYGADRAMVVANRYYTPSAKELAEATGVRLVGRDELQGYLDEYNRVLLAQ